MVNLFESMTVWWDFMNTFFLFFGCATVLSFHVQAFEPHKRSTASEVTAAVLRLIDHENPEIFRSLKLRFWIWYIYWQCCRIDVDPNSLRNSLRLSSAQLAGVRPTAWQASSRPNYNYFDFLQQSNKASIIAWGTAAQKKGSHLFIYIYIYVCGCSLILDNKFFGPSNWRG